MSTEGFKNDGNMIADFVQIDIEGEIRDSEQHKPWQSGLYSKTLVKKEDLRAVLITMDAGAAIKEHHADGSITVQVLRGEIRFRTQGQEHALKGGQMLTLGRSIKHALEAVEDSAVLLTISWPSAEELQMLKHRGYST